MATKHNTSPETEAGQEPAEFTAHKTESDIPENRQYPERGEKTKELSKHFGRSLLIKVGAPAIVAAGFALATGVGGGGENPESENIPENEINTGTIEPGLGEGGSVEIEDGTVVTSTPPEMEEQPTPATVEPIRYSEAELSSFTIEEGEAQLNNRERILAADLISGNGQEWWVSENADSDVILDSISSKIKLAYESNEPRILWATFKDIGEGSAYENIKQSVVDGDMSRMESLINTFENASIERPDEGEQGIIEVVLVDNEDSRQVIDAEYNFGHFQLAE